MPESSIYKKLTECELQLIVEKHLDTKKFKYSLLSGGMFNTTYLISLLEKSQTFVLRVGPINRQLLLPFEHNLMNAEKRFNDLCSSQDVPVSKIIACVTNKQMIDRDYMLVEYIESVPLSSVSVSSDVKNKLFEKVGYYASKINSITGKEFGRLSHILQGKGCLKWSKYLQKEIEEWTSKTQEIDIFTHGEIEAIKSIFIKYAEILDEITVPHLVHADLWEGNILVGNDQNSERVLAIIDGDRAIFGDMDFEFASEWMINDSFIKGYGASLKMDSKSVSRRKIYSIIFHLIDAYVCLAEYNNEKNSTVNKNSALKLVNELINN